MITEKLNEAWFFAKYSVGKLRALTEFRELIKNQTFSQDALEELSWKKTKALVNYAYSKVPFYRNRFNSHKLHPNDMKFPDDFNKVPVLTRKDLQENFNDIISAEAKLRKLKLSTTGGSTGEPVRVYLDKRVVRAAMGWRMLSWWNISPAANYASAYRQAKTTNRTKLIDKFFWWPTKRAFLDATNLNKSAIINFLDSFKKVRPEYLHGYVGAIDYVASFIDEHCLSVVSPKVIWTTSAPLTRVQENHIEKSFAAPVLDQYGCCEVYWLAAQCPARQAMHMFSDTRKIEFLDDQNRPVPAGTMGNIAVTDLQNYLFPIIRYLNGDRGRALPGTCSCGVTLPLMDKVRGRVSDNISLPNGSQISGEFLTTIFDETPEAVKQFQVHQKKDYSLEITVVPNPSYTGLDLLLMEIEAQLIGKIGQDIVIRFKKTDSIPQVGGKLCFIKSDLVKGRP